MLASIDRLLTLRTRKDFVIKTHTELIQGREAEIIRFSDFINSIICV